jgi:hypothetical protein
VGTTIAPTSTVIQIIFSTCGLLRQSVSVDLLVVPGGTPMDEMAISAPQMWGEGHGPIPPQALQISVTPLRHFTVYDRVEVMIKLDLVASGSRFARQRWACSVENRVTLADRPSVTPSLWDLRKARERGRSELWLALFDQKNRPVPRDIYESGGCDGICHVAAADTLHARGSVSVGTVPAGLLG